MNICSAPFAPSFWTPHLLSNTPQIATDTFDRPNTASGLGISDSGQQWKNNAGANDNVWGIASNLAKASGTANQLAWLECNGLDGTVSVELPTNGSKVGLICRYFGGAYLKVWFNGGNVELMEHNPTDVVIGTAVQAATNGVTLKVSLHGSTINVYVDNALLITTTSTLNLFTGTKAGLFSDLNSTARFNNFNFVYPAPENVTDDFNRADSATLGTASDGIHTWFSKTGNHGIQTNRARNPVGTANLFTCIASNAPNCTIQVTLPINLNGTSIGFRATDGSNFLFAGWSGGNLVLVKKVANVNTTIASASPTVAPANGQVLKVVLSNSSIEVYVDNVLKISATETFNQLANQHGLYSSFGSSTYRYDDFSITV